MAKKKTYYIKDWNSLIKLINQTNTNKETIMLIGYHNKIFKDSVFIDTLLFKKVPVDFISYNKSSKKK